MTMAQPQRGNLDQLILQAVTESGLYRAPWERDAIVGVFKAAYEAGLYAGALDIQQSLFRLGRVPSPNVALAFNLRNPLALYALEQRALLLIKNIDDTTRNYMLQVFRNALTEQGPGSPGAIVRAIRDNLTADEGKAFGKKRVESIVNTELNYIHSNARVEQYQHAGLTRKRWVAVPAVACAICLGNQRLGPVPLDFASWNSVFGLVSHPPGHPGTCHCHVDADLAELEDIATEGIEFWDGGVGEERSYPSVELHLPGQHDQSQDAETAP